MSLVILSSLAISTSILCQWAIFIYTIFFRSLWSLHLLQRRKGTGPMLCYPWPAFWVRRLGRALLWVIWVIRLSGTVTTVTRLPHFILVSVFGFKDSMEVGIPALDLVRFKSRKDCSMHCKLQLVSCNPKNNTISFSLRSLDAGGLSNQFTIHRYDSYEHLISHNILKYSSYL